jgi:hypothetical protein
MRGPKVRFWEEMRAGDFKADRTVEQTGTTREQTNKEQWKWNSEG